MEIDPMLATLATGLGIAVAAFVAYLKKPPSGTAKPPDDNTVIVGGSMADRESMRMLATALIRVAEGIEEYNQATHDQGIRDKAREDYSRRGPSRT